MLTRLFCDIDDFCQIFLPQWEQRLLQEGMKRRRTRSLSHSEMMTLLVHFHQLGFRTLKYFYLRIKTRVFINSLVKQLRFFTIPFFHRLDRR